MGPQRQRAWVRSSRWQGDPTCHRAWGELGRTVEIGKRARMDDSGLHRFSFSFSLSIFFLFQIQIFKPNSNFCLLIFFTHLTLLLFPFFLLIFCFEF